MSNAPYPLGSPYPLDPFSLEQRLSQWNGCVLEVRCRCSPRMVMIPVRLLLGDGDRQFKSVVARLRCAACGGPPKQVFLVAGHHRHYAGSAPPDWSIPLLNHEEPFDEGV